MRISDWSSDVCSSDLSQAHRYLQAYINTGLVQQEPADGRYSLGPTALKIGLSALSRLDVIRITTAYLRQLADDLETTGLLSIWGDYGPTIIRWLDGGVPIATSLHVGSVLPIQIGRASCWGKSVSVRVDLGGRRFIKKKKKKKN